MSAWIGVDLDGTLAHYDGWVGEHHIGEPLWPMVETIKKWLEAGYTVKIVTARMCGNRSYCQEIIQDWLEKQCGLPRLECTNEKDYGMVMLYDDRAITVIKNTGVAIGDKLT